MNWLSWFSAESKMIQVADRLAAKCQEQVWRIVQHQAVAMSPAEARGYVRARAGLLVLHAVEAEVHSTRRGGADREQLRDLTTERVVRLIGAQLRAVRPVARGTRRAA